MKKRSAATQRRYDLHRAIKLFAKVMPYQKKIFLEQGTAEYITPKQLQKINELKSVHGYSVQYSVPGTMVRVKHRISKRVMIKREKDGVSLEVKDFAQDGRIMKCTTGRLTRSECKDLVAVLNTEIL